jgi:ankyrin repeat protein
MIWAAVPVTAGMEEYERQAVRLLEDWRSGDDLSLQYFHEHLPRMKDEKIRWLSRPMTDEELRGQVFDLDDARAAVARGYDFADWDALTSFASAMERREEGVFTFECAVEAVVDGDAAGLRALLAGRPSLAQERSTRVTWFDPPVHGATLLVYVASNGTENYRQRTPKNAVEIATRLLDAGADVNATAALYGSTWATLGLLASSSHPAEAGVQLPLIELLVSRGAEIGNALDAALVHGHRAAAELLARLGGRVGLAEAAGLGRAEKVRELLTGSDADTRHRALALSAQWGEVETARLLLDAGEDPNRFNPPGTHTHSTPLHQAALGGYLEVVRLLVERGARLGVRDTIYDATPLGWARHGGKADVASWLEGAGAN